MTRLRPIRRSQRRLGLGVALSLALVGCDSSNAPAGPASPESQSAAAPVAEPRSSPAPPGADAEPSTPAEPPRRAYEPRPEDLVSPHQPLEFAENLTPFLDALTAVDDGEERLVRVVHMGASMIGADDLTGVLRERFQTRFGDGGAGVVLMQRYMPNYLHRWVKLDASGWEHCYIAYKCLPDRHYGIGGTAFWSKGGAKTTIRTRDEELGDEVSRFELWYAARPGGGRLEVRVDGGEPELIDTRADQLEDRFHEIDVEPGPHKIEVKAVGHGSARAYGVLLETDGPGITWDQFSKLGVFTRRVLEWDPEHLARQIAHRDPDLIVFTYGGNDVRRVALGKISKDDYVGEYMDVIAHMRRGKPEAACLVIGMTDRGKSLSFDIEPEDVETIVAGQREAAQKSGCAFFDTYEAMGGGGSLQAWMRMSPPLAAGDLKHLNHRGRIKLGGWIYDAVISAYVTRRNGGEPVPVPAPAPETGDEASADDGTASDAPSE